MLDIPMKKLAVAAAFLSLSIAAPVFACPLEDAPKTAEKAKDSPPAQAQETAKANKADKAKPVDKAAPADKAKPADKVSQR